MNPFPSPQFIQSLFASPRFLQLFHSQISHSTRLSQHLNQTIQTVPQIIQQIYSSIQTISKCTIKDLINNSQYELVKQNQLIMREIEEIKNHLLCVGGENEQKNGYKIKVCEVEKIEEIRGDRDGNRGSWDRNRVALRPRDEISKFNSTSHIRLDCLTQQSLLDQLASPHCDFIKIHQDIEKVNRTMTNIVARSPQTTRPNTNTHKNKQEIQFDFIPEIHSRIFQNVTIRSPLRKGSAYREADIDRGIEKNIGGVGKKEERILELNSHHDDVETKNNYSCDYDIQSTLQENIILKRKLKEYQMKGCGDYEGRFNRISNALNKIEKDLDEVKRSASTQENSRGERSCGGKKKGGNFASRLHWK